MSNDSHPEITLERWRGAGAAFSPDFSASLATFEKYGWAVTGNPLHVDGPTGGKALSFDGASRLNTGSKPDRGLTAISISVWAFVDPDDFDGGAATILDNSGLSPGSNSGFDLLFDDRGGANPTKGVFFEFKGSSGRIGRSNDNVISVAGWYHIICIYSVNVFEFYINAVDEMSSGTPDGNYNPGDFNLTVGANTTDGTFPLTGRVGDVLIFPRVLTATEVSQIYNNTVFKYKDKLISMWHGDSPNWRDAIGSNDGTGTGLDDTNIVAGINGLDRATSFNGTDEREDMGDIGLVKTVVHLVNPGSTTEQFTQLDAGKSIDLSGGAVTYTGITASATFVDDEASTTVVADRFQLIVSTFNTAIVSADFSVAYDGTNFGAIKSSVVGVFSDELTQLQVTDMNRLIRQGTF